MKKGRFWSFIRIKVVQQVKIKSRLGIKKEPVCVWAIDTREVETVQLGLSTEIHETLRWAHRRE